jgi:peptidoglycan hydrolase-like protein with peptidoglycan-binding domain
MAVVQRLKLNEGPNGAIGNLQQQLNAIGAAPRVPITGRFDAATEAAVKAFQTSKGLPATGETDAATHKELNKAAPLTVKAGETTVEHGAANVHGETFAGWEGTHKMGTTGGPAGGADVARGAKTNRPAVVRELQQRLNGSGALVAAKTKLSVDGVFGPLTESGLKLFQAANGILPATGVADVATWGKLETAGGAATGGRVEFEWRETVEGVSNVGGRAKYEWRLTATELRITAGINFIPKAKGVQPKINDWLSEIRQIWNSFKGVSKTDPAAKPVEVNFEAQQGGKDFNINVLKKPGFRSDAANWNALDARRGVAAHEFGHLSGLSDEYNRDEGQVLATTGQEPPVGNPAGDAAKADTLANGIKAAMPLTDDGTVLAGVVTTDLAQQQGGYSRFVAQRYRALQGSDIVADITNAFTAKGFTGFHGPKTRAITPFLYSSRGIMGTMEEAAVPGHGHPVEARHIQPFVDIISREHGLAAGAPQQWEAKPR